MALGDEQQLNAVARKLNIKTLMFSSVGCTDANKKGHVEPTRPYFLQFITAEELFDQRLQISRFNLLLAFRLGLDRHRLFGIITAKQSRETLDRHELL